MPLSIELLSNKYKAWLEIHHAGPDDKTVVLPQFLPDGGRKMYVLECDESDFFTSMYTFLVPSNVESTAEAVMLIAAGELMPNSTVTINKGDNYYYAVKSAEGKDREIVVFSHE